VGRVIARTCTLAYPPRAGQARYLHTVRKKTGTGEVLDVLVHMGIVDGRRLGTVATIRPSRGRVSAVLGAVNASAQCADRYAASGIDRASAQLGIWPLRDGRRQGAREDG